jgi:hypothetical protein
VVKFDLKCLEYLKRRWHGLLSCVDLSCENLVCMKKSLFGEGNRCCGCHVVLLSGRKKPPRLRVLRA